ncbi:MAG TPA: hypothetical protein VFL12_01740 [Thermoanaerobaculia bacterium]|nr:hypothetical protein [Thermoanaerobaculia bacterium]
MARPERDPLTPPPERRDDEEPEADFGATVRWMAAIFAAIVLLALLIGWFLTR